MNKRRRLLWTLFPSYLLIVLFSLGAVAGYASFAIRRFHIERRTADIEIRARMILRQLPASFPGTKPDSLTTFTQSLAAAAATRVTIVSKLGHILADSEEPRGAETLAHLPEIHEALEGRTGVAQRYSVGAQSQVLYVAVPVHRKEKVVGAIRVSVSLASLAPELEDLNARILVIAVIVALAVATITFIITRRIGRAAAEMKHGAERFAAGDFSLKVGVPDSEELGGLALALNGMAEQLDATIRTITFQRNEQQAILTSLRESVIAVDSGEHVLFVNRAASELLGLDSNWAVGRLMQEVVRVGELQHFISTMLSGPAAAAQAEIRPVYNPTQVLQVTSTELRNASGARFGLLIVVNDVTRLRRLETIRREFVANVSHELKTPITAIKGFVETLSEGGIADPDTIRQFLARIHRNTERLNTIIDDLLLLSRVEQEGEQGNIPLVDSSLCDVVEGAIAGIAPLAAERNVTIDFTCPQDVFAPVNPTLLEQAVVNLLDNAVKYSDPGSTVTVELGTDGNDVAIHVRDRGMGVPAEHLARLFERFYRVDKARSRKLGGTGLGLAIVKHIVQAHAGRVTAQSTPGEGSTFSIFIPSGRT